MKLYLVRHGEAEESLTAKGKEESARNALLLKQTHPSISKIYHSTKIRAAETAQIFHEILGHHIPCEVKEGLKPNDSPHPLLNEISEAKESFMVVSHLPFLEKVATHLLYGEETALPFSFEGGSVIILERKSGQWKLVGLIYLPEARVRVS